MCHLLDIGILSIIKFKNKYIIYNNNNNNKYWIIIVKSLVCNKINNYKYSYNYFLIIICD